MALLRRSQVLVAAMAIAIAVGACTTLTVDGSRLQGTTWKAVSIAGQAPIAGWEPTITFDARGVHGSTGCNGFAGEGPVTVSDGHLDLGDHLLMTSGACVGADGEDLPVMAVEQQFWDALRSADHVAIRDRQLVISGGGGELVFERRT